MNYSETVKSMLVSSINELISQPELYAARPGRDFSRCRKLCFKDLLLMLLTMEAECIKEEIYTYFGRTTSAPSKSAFCRQRKKLKTDALRWLLFNFNKKCKKNLYDGKYSLIACDGSAANIFRDPDDKDTFFEPNGKSTRGFNQVHVNALFSILDRRFTDLLVQPSRKRNEYRAFCQIVDRAEDDHPVIYICDRGYASYNNFAHIKEKKQFFLIRCTDAKTEKILGFPLDGVKELDFHVDRILTRSNAKKKRLQPDRAEDYKYICKDVPFDFITEGHPEYELSLRIVRVEITKGNFINLITNLPDHEFDMDDLKELYRLRWDEETGFRDMKYPLCLKAFHSKKCEYIEQEIWARAILHNFCSEISMNVEVPKRERKHLYQVNFSEAVKICRDYLRADSCMNVEGLIAQNVEPVRPGRTFPRQKRFQFPMSFCYRN